jgi:hypothetical protein
LGFAAERIAAAVAAARALPCQIKPISIALICSATIFE